MLGSTSRIASEGVACTSSTSVPNAWISGESALTPHQYPLSACQASTCRTPWCCLSRATIAFSPPVLVLVVAATSEEERGEEGEEEEASDAGVLRRRDAPPFLMRCSPTCSPPAPRKGATVVSAPTAKEDGRASNFAFSVTLARRLEWSPKFAKKSNIAPRRKLRLASRHNRKGTEKGGALSTNIWYVSMINRVPRATTELHIRSINVSVLLAAAAVVVVVVVAVFVVVLLLEGLAGTLPPSAPVSALIAAASGPDSPKRASSDVCTASCTAACKASDKAP